MGLFEKTELFEKSDQPEEESWNQDEKCANDGEALPAPLSRFIKLGLAQRRTLIVISPPSEGPDDDGKEDAKEVVHLNLDESHCFAHALKHDGGFGLRLFCASG